MNDRIELLISIYCISLYGDDKLRVGCSMEAKKAGDLDEIIASKPQILARLKAKEAETKKAYAEYCAKLDAITGLKELQDAIDDLNLWHEEYEASFAECGGLGVRPKPTYDLEAMRKKFPRAAAYLKAKSYSQAANWAKASAGKEAAESILNGEDYEQVIAKMEEKWGDHCTAHIWD